MEGEATFSEKKHFWSKPVDNVHKIHLYSGVEGICDESEVEQEIERLTTEELKSPGWGKNFSGWQRVVPYEEVLEIAKEKGWDTDDIPKGEVNITYIDTWKMDTILKRLTGRQFARFCKDHAIAFKGEMFND